MSITDYLPRLGLLDRHGKHRAVDEVTRPARLAPDPRRHAVAHPRRRHHGGPVLMSPLAFIDCETFGLDPEKHAMWELAIIRRENGVDTEHLWQIKPYPSELRDADPEALSINRYDERMVLPDDYQVGDMTHACGLPHPMKRVELRTVLHSLLDGAVLVGSNPAFDASFLRLFLDGAPWHYRTVDIATLAAGYVSGLAASAQHSGTGDDVTPLPFSSRRLSRQVGVEPPGEDGHQALVDARWARDVYDAVMGGDQ